MLAFEVQDPSVLAKYPRATLRLDHFTLILRSAGVVHRGGASKAAGDKGTRTSVLSRLRVEGGVCSTAAVAARGEGPPSNVFWLSYLYFKRLWTDHCFVLASLYVCAWYAENDFD